MNDDLKLTPVEKASVVRAKKKLADGKGLTPKEKEALDKHYEIEASVTDGTDSTVDMVAPRANLPVDDPAPEHAQDPVHKKPTEIYTFRSRYDFQVGLNMEKKRLSKDDSLLRLPFTNNSLSLTPSLCQSVGHTAEELKEALMKHGSYEKDFALVAGKNVKMTETAEQIETVANIQADMRRENLVVHSGVRASGDV